MEGVVQFVGHAVTLRQEALELVDKGDRPTTLGVEGQSRDAIIAHELNQFARIGVCAVKLLLRELVERLARFVVDIDASTPVDEVGATGAHAVFVGGIVERAGHAPPAVAPVGVCVDVLPQVEVVAVEVVTGQCAPLLGHFACRHAPAEVFVVLVVEVRVGPYVRQEAFLDRHARDEEILVVIGCSHTEILARFPVFQGGHDVRGRSILHIHFVRRHALRTGP